jgi:Winged helix DNA-binding domain
MCPDPTFDDAARRSRLAARHLLSPVVADARPLDVTRALVALHATDPATVYLAIRARSRSASPEAIDQALYDDRVLYRMLAMRRTMFVVDRELAPAVTAAVGRTVAARTRKGLLDHLAGGGLDEAWLANVEGAVLQTLREHGPSTGMGLRTWVPELTEQVLVAAGTKYEAQQAVASRIIRLLAAENRIERDRPRGTWTSSQFRWRLADELPEVDEQQARRSLVAQWLRAYGPATEADLRWWTGWNLGDVRACVAGLDVTTVALERGTGMVLADDVDVPVEAPPWVAFLPALDPTPMGWKTRDWFLPAMHRKELFDSAGNIGPSVWADGRIIGGWAQRSDGDVVFRLLEDVGVEREEEVAEEAERVRRWIGDVRITPRFRTPLERGLADD